MAYKSILKSESVARYVNVDMLGETEVQKRLREETMRLPQGRMMISADQGAFLGMMVRLLRARRVVEIGTFTGYSALCLAMALENGGSITCCDINEEWTEIAKRFWREAGVENKIDLRIGPALMTLQNLIAKSGANTFDLAFIDADKDAYGAYYEASLQLLKPGGLIIMDNIMGGKGHDSETFDPVTSNMHELNLRIKADKRVDAMIATVGGGFMLVRKK